MPSNPSNSAVPAEWLASEALERLGLVETERARRNLTSIFRSGITDDLVPVIWHQLRQALMVTGDPDRALNNLERFFQAARSPLALAALLERDRTALPILLTLFSTSQYLSDLLIRDSESYDYLRMTEGQLYARHVLVDELGAELRSIGDWDDALTVLRRFKHRETLRISFGDLIVQHAIADVTEQISWVAEAICEAALEFAWRKNVERWGTPRTRNGDRCPFTVLAMGKLGGRELNYSSDIDLVFVYEQEGQTESGRDNAAWFDRLARDFVKLLSEPTELGIAYRVDLRLRPEGSRGRICNSLPAMLRYYDLQGRTWERQALIKARPIAGDRDLGAHLLARLRPWIYGRILNRQDVSSIRALKRKIERQARLAGEEEINVKTGHGGIRDIEFVIQFLQLLHGTTEPHVQTPNTLDAIQELARADCLSMQESRLLMQNYGWLRKLEHRLQIMHDLQTHTLPESEAERSRIAWRMGYRPYFGRSPREQFQNDLLEVTSVNRRILDHLLHSGFGNPLESEGEPAEVPLEVDLVLDPNPPAEMVDSAYRRAGFQHPEQAQHHLLSLAQETTVFLSSRRARHFLAAIAPRLLARIGATPDPDATLAALAGVADSIGGKAVLWELFQFHPPSMDLFVRMCAATDYLCDILRRSPGMIDDLVDSLMLEQLPDLDWLRHSLRQLLANAQDPSPIVHSFKNAQHLRIGVRDIVGRDPIRQTHRALADVAQVCLEQAAELAFAQVAEKFARPGIDRDTLHATNPFVILGLGKIGGREPNYHSDIDVIFLHRTDCRAQTNEFWTTSTQHVFSEMAASITRWLSQLGPHGRLYEIDSRLRPTGKSGSLACSFEKFQQYFASGQGALWERLALCKARVVYGQPEHARQAMAMVHNAIAAAPWSPDHAETIRQMRFRMQEGSQPENLKRGIGGTVDIEFIVQMLQVRNADRTELLVPETLHAIQMLGDAGILPADEATMLKKNYETLRGVEARLRLMNTTARHDLPTQQGQLEKLAFLLRYEDPQRLVQDVSAARRSNRELFERIFNRAQQG